MATVGRPGDFSQQASAYVRARPGYPPGFVSTLVDGVRLHPGATIAEFGAGTGLFTQQLSGRGFEILAIDPTAAMRELAAPMADVRWLEGRFEDCPASVETVDWVVVAHAFHWADPQRALAEFHRISRPAGPLTVLWNVRDLDASALLRTTRALIDERVPGFDEGYHRREWGEVLTCTGHFGEVEYREVPNLISMSHARFLDLWRSHNKLTRACADVGGIDNFVTALEQALVDFPDPVEVPYRCRAWTARRT